MKKILSLALALAMIGTALTGCGSKDAATKTPAENTQQTAPVQQEQSQTEKALALINTFATGDTDTARSLLADGYIQHNLAYGTGADAFIGSVEYLASADVKTTVNNIRAFEDGDKVFLQTIYNFAGAGEQVAFDIFRFDENGKIAEHWDNLAALAEPNPSGHTQTDGTMEVTDLDKTEENRELVKNFLYDVMQGNNLDKTPDYFDGDNYIQHNSGIADGVSGLNAALGALAEQGISMVYDEVHMVLAQGNFVLAVSEGTFGGTPTSYYDLWRVENGKIAEHIADLTPIQPGLYLWQGDITTLKCDAIVNAANSGMTGCYIPNHRCIDNAIHTYAGVELRLACAELMATQGHPEPTGQAKITPAFNLPCRYVLHTVGPIIDGRVTKEDAELLASCYRSCLELAAENSLESVAFCCISTGEFHFPNELAAEIAVRTVKEFLKKQNSVKKVIFNVFKDLDKTIYEKLLRADRTAESSITGL